MIVKWNRWMEGRSEKDAPIIMWEVGGRISGWSGSRRSEGDEWRRDG